MVRSPKNYIKKDFSGRGGVLAPMVAFGEFNNEIDEAGRRHDH